MSLMHLQIIAKRTYLYSWAKHYHRRNNILYVSLDAATSYAQNLEVYVGPEGPYKLLEFFLEPDLHISQYLGFKTTDAEKSVS